LDLGLNEKTISELGCLIKQGEVSPRDLAMDLLEAISNIEPKINAYLDVYGDELLSAAEKLSTERLQSSGPLAGIPLAVKDNICIKNKKTTCGSRMLADFISPYSATAIERLQAMGALICGKTNMDEFAMGSSTEHSAFGVSRNPWNLSRTPGGSSGGSAAAVAADTAIAALGSDTGGSVRQPAGFCGVVGVKPTYGRVSRYGLVAFASSLDQIGAITKCVDDAAVIMSVICGKDKRDATSLKRAVPDFSSSLAKGMNGLTIGIPWHFLEKEMNTDVRENFDKTVRMIRDANIPLVDVRLTHVAYAVSCYYVIADAEASSNLARYDGVRYGYRSENHNDVVSMYEHSRMEGFGEEVKRRILLGTYVLSSGYYDAYYAQAQKVRRLIVDDFTEAFKTCDLIMLPTSPTPAFKLGEKIDDPLQMYLSDMFTVPASLAGLPAISLPSGLSGDGLPLAVQLLGGPLEEEKVLRGARALEEMISFKEKAHA
jgi:aspartyl-tRNA(Asn)/glutamyl-tRNA(Gln) amidotransferase subunit A